MVVNKKAIHISTRWCPCPTLQMRTGLVSSNLSNFINKDDSPGNSPNLNPMENIFSMLNEIVYCDPKPQLLDELKNESERHGGVSLLTV